LTVSALCFVTCGIAAAPLPQQLTAQVTRVTDGDTIVVTDVDYSEHVVRIVSIDAPEKRRREVPGQRYSNQSRKYLAALVAGKQVRLMTRGRDDYGRVLARVWIDGRDVGLAQVCAGYAWVYEAFVSELTVAEQRAYQNCQAAAKANRRGLWRDAQPTPPWVWRQTQTRREIDRRH